MADTNEEFRQVFEEIKSTINSLAGLDESRQFEISEACRRSNRVKNRRQELEYIRDVRNAQNHPQQVSGQPTFVVTDAFVGVCRRIHAQLARAVPAGKLGVKRGDLCVANWDDTILPLINTMRENKFSHIPILDDVGAVSGVFNESAILDYLMASGMISMIEPETKLREIHKHCMIGADHVETFRFISPLASEDQVAEIFLTVTGMFTRVGAVFVTPDGEADKPIQRMITAWDVLAQSKVK